MFIVYTKHKKCLGCNNESVISDGICDDETNTRECFYDGGDCCGYNVNTIYCTECQCKGTFKDF